jgi:hypothetical protein
MPESLFAIAIAIAIAITGRRGARIKLAQGGNAHTLNQGFAGVELHEAQCRRIGGDSRG